MKKFIKKLLTAFIAITVAAASSVYASAAPSFETADAAVENISAGWNLGNSLDSCGSWIKMYTDGNAENYETAWGNPVTEKELITTVKNAGFNAIRVPVTWTEHIDSSGNIDKDWLDRVQEVIDYVISQNLYCVLNVHHDAGADGWIEASAECYKNNSEKFSGLWKNIANRFKNYGDKLIFEGFNEILDNQNSWTNAQDSGAYKAVNDFNQLFVDTVRKTGGNNSVRNLMVQVYSGSCSEQALAGFKLPNDSVENHLIIHVHNYDPQAFTANDATWTTMTDTWGSTEDKQYFDSLFERLGNFSEKQGVPLVIGEFGANYKGNEASRMLYADYFVTCAEKHGIKCFWWDTGDMALFDRSNFTVKYPEIVSVLTKFSVQTTDENEILDAPKILKYSVKLASAIRLIAADYTRDGYINLSDAEQILKNMVF